MIGVFDSGLGGLTVVRRLRERLPLHDLLFFADQAHVPYGDRAPDELRRLLHANVAWLEAQGVDLIVMGCNTSCAMGRRFGWPDSRAPVLDLIASAADAVAETGPSRVAVLATAATVASGAYGAAIRAVLPAAEVREIAAPALVPLVEAGDLSGARAESAVEAVCRAAADAQTVVLGCTHYPMLEPLFRAALGPGVRILDPALAQAERAALRAVALAPGTGSLRCVTNGDAVRFDTAVRRLAGDLAPIG